MTYNQEIVHHVQPQHIYSCDGTYTRGGLCIRHQRLVAFCIFYFLDHISIYDISVLLTRVQCTFFMYQISSFSMETVLHYILYMAMTTHDICLLCLFMDIVLLCMQDCYVFAVICRDLLLYFIDEWLVFST